MAIDYRLPIQFYQVGRTHFEDSHILAMVARTNLKLQPVGIEIETLPIQRVGTVAQAYVSQSKQKEPELFDLLTSNGHQPLAIDRILRVFLVKADLDGCHGSWTYDPTDDDEYRAAIFITEQFRDNSDEAYVAQQHPASSDTLLHELGHSLMWEAVHEGSATPNFFHHQSDLLDDSITAEQRIRLRGEDLGRPANARNYLRPVP